MSQIPVLNLPGPDFLNVYGVVVIGVLLVAALLIHFADNTDSNPPPVPQRPDAVEVAFLQGGVNQIIRMVVYDLAQRGFARLDKAGNVVPTERQTQPGELNAVAQRVLDTIRAKPTARQLFENRGLRAKLLELLEPVRSRLAAQDLLKPEAVKRWRLRAQVFGVLTLLGFSGAKIIVALRTGHTNVSYLIFLTAASIAVLFALAYVLTRTHASRRGRAWLANMRLAFKGRLDDALLDIGAPAAIRPFEGASLFLIGLYGFSVFKGTPEAMFYESFKRGSSSDISNCGSSCGGSCGSGDGGGGCGGCGGGD